MTSRFHNRQEQQAEIGALRAGRCVGGAVFAQVRAMDCGKARLQGAPGGYELDELR